MQKTLDASFYKSFTPRATRHEHMLLLHITTLFHGYNVNVMFDIPAETFQEDL